MDEKKPEKLITAVKGGRGGGMPYRSSSTTKANLFYFVSYLREAVKKVPPLMARPLRPYPPPPRA